MPGTVRYVSPVTARLFSKNGPKALGLPSEEVLATRAEIDGSRSGGYGGGRHSAAAWRQAPQGEGIAGIAESAPPPVDAGGGSEESRQHRVEVLRQYSISPVNGPAAMCPQSYLESILKERVSQLGLKSRSVIAAINWNQHLADHLGIFITPSSLYVQLCPTVAFFLLLTLPTDT